MIFQNFGFNRQKVSAAGPTFSYPAGAFAIYDFGNPSSYSGTGATVYDVSGNSNNGTLFNSPTWSSTNGGILNLASASSQYIQYSGQFSENFSGVWIWKNTDTTNQAYSGWPSARGNNGIILTFDISSSPIDKQVIPLAANNTGGFNAYGGTYLGPADITIFHQYATTFGYSAGNTECINYLDGGGTSVSETKALDRSGAAQTVDAYLGYDYPNGGRFANGYVMAYLHYNTVLTTTDLNNLYTTFSSRF
jgi:hypothetical protein